MQTPFKIEPTKSTPYIEFDKQKNCFKIIGRSLPENSYEIYAPAIAWLKEYIQHPNENTNLEIHLDYINSGSLKQLFRILYLLEDLMELGSETIVTWNYSKNDELMFEKGKEFQQFLSIPIQVKEV